MFNSRKISYTLKDEEKKLFRFELSKENVPYVLIELKRNFNETYQLIMNIFKKIFSVKKNNNILANELEKYIQELEKCELNVLRHYKIMMFYLQLSKVDINTAEICLEFENEQEKNELLKLIKERGVQLKIFKENINKLETLKLKVNVLHEIMMSLSDNDNLE